MVNEFKDFFRYEDFELQAESDNKHVHFINRHTGYLFGHDFPKGKSLDQSFVQIKNKYDRRISRILSFLRTKNANNLLFFSDGNSKSCSFEDVRDNVVKDFQKIKQFYSDSNLSLIYFFNDKNDKSSYFKIEDVSDDILFVRFKQQSDDFIDFYHKYFNFKYFIGNYISRVEYKFWGRVLLVLVKVIPVKALRKNLRHVVRYGFVEDKFHIVGR